MSLDYGPLLEAVKQAAIGAVLASKPFSLAFGLVTSTAPLKIRLDQRLELTAAQLVLTSSVRNHTAEMTVEHETEEAQVQGTGHRHAYKGKKTFTVHGALRAGEHVLLLRADGGQKYIVLDRMEDAT